MDKAINKISKAMDETLEDYTNGMVTKGESLLVILDSVKEEIAKYKEELEGKNTSLVEELNRLK